MTTTRETEHMSNDKTTGEATPIPKGFNEVLTRGTEGGVEWFTARAPLWGAVNGYARLPEGHPWRDLSLQDADYDVVDVHGGITYGPKDDGWIGFDTLHAGDVWPGGDMLSGYDDDLHWTPEMVADQARNLARQIAEVTA